MRRANRCDHALDFILHGLAKRFRRLLESRFDHRRVLFRGQRGIFVQIIQNPAFALRHGLGAKFLARQIVTPVTKSAFGKLLNVSLVYQCHARTLIRQRKVNGAPDQPLRPRGRNGFNAHAGIPANLLFAIFQHVVIQELQQPFRFRRTGLPLNSDINILSIFPENHQIHFLGMLHGRRNSVKIAHRTLARIQVQQLAQRHVQ